MHHGHIEGYWTLRKSWVDTNWIIAYITRTPYHSGERTIFCSIFNSMRHLFAFVQSFLVCVCDKFLFCFSLICLSYSFAYGTANDKLCCVHVYGRQWMVHLELCSTRHSSSSLWCIDNENIQTQQNRQKCAHSLFLMITNWYFSFFFQSFCSGLLNHKQNCEYKTNLHMCPDMYDDLVGTS